MSEHYWGKEGINSRYVNLLEETREIIERNGLKTSDVVYVGTCEKSCSWDEFAEYAKDFWYYPGFGGQQVNADLMVVGGDWWLDRDEYDGSEWWTFNKLPEKPSDNFYKKDICTSYLCRACAHLKNKNK